MTKFTILWKVKNIYKRKRMAMGGKWKIDRKRKDSLNVYEIVYTYVYLKKFILLSLPTSFPSYSLYIFYENQFFKFSFSSLSF